MNHSEDRDDELEREIRAAFGRSRLPAAPPSVRNRVADLASEPVAVRAGSRPPMAALLAAAFVLLALVGTAVLVGSRILVPLQSPAATVGTLPSAAAQSPGATSTAVIVTPEPATMAPTPDMTAGPTSPPTAATTAPAFVPPGTMQLFLANQPTSGDGWRILGGAAGLDGPRFDSETIELYTDGGVLKPLDALGLPPGAGGVDPAHDVIAVADILVGDASPGSACGHIRLDAVTFDPAKRVVTLRYEDTFDPQPSAGPQLACGLVGHAARFMVALAVDHLPTQAFSLLLMDGTRQVAEATNLSAPVPPSPSDAPLVDAAGTFRKGGLWIRHGRTLWTMDGGMDAWQRIQLPVDPIDVDVEDPAAVRVVSAGPGSVWPYGGNGQQDVLHLLFSVTDDAGRTWTSTPIAGNFGGLQPVLRFASPSSGYLLLASFRGGPDSRIFVTSDGGATWTERTALLKSSAGPAVPGYLGAIFSVGPDGSLWTGSQGDAGPVGRPILDVSRDGGDTWTDARLPGLIGDVTAPDYLLSAPVFFGSDGLVAATIEGQDAVTTSIFATADGGRTWTRSASALEASDGMAFTPLSRTDWYLETSGGLMTTQNAGQTWRAAGPPLDVGQIEWLGFEDPNRGFAIVDVRGDPYTSRLYATRDGGATWEPAVLTAP